MRGAVDAAAGTADFVEIAGIGRLDRDGLDVDSVPCF